MYIQIDNAAFVNKGAELMLVSVIEKLSSAEKLKASFVFGMGWAEAKDLRRVGLFQKALLQRYKIRWEKLFPQPYLDQLGLVKTNNINAVLDAGGFQFTDYFVNAGYKERNNSIRAHYKNLKESAKKIIFLPQAYGPFTNPLAIERIKIAYNYGDLFYARDIKSYEYLTSIFGESPKIKQSPDFTNLCEGALPLSFYSRYKDCVIIIPNSKMLTQTKEESGKKYTLFMLYLLKHLKKSGENVIILNHEGMEDINLAHRLQKESSAEIPVISGLTAKEIKGLIGISKVTISSRFHGVVSGLSQGVPTFCTSWAHKYKYLLEDYDAEDMMINFDDIETSVEKVSCMLSPELNDQTRKKLVQKSNKQKILAEKMWREVIENLCECK